MSILDDLIILPGNRDEVKNNVEGSVVRRAYVDCSENNLDSGDFYKIFAYGANTIISDVHVVTETVEEAGDTLDITDDTAGTTTLVSNHDVNTDNAISNYRTGIFKESAGHLAIKPDADLTVCKFWVTAKFTPLTVND